MDRPETSSPSARRLQAIRGNEWTEYQRKRNMRDKRSFQVPRGESRDRGRSSGRRRFVFVSSINYYPPPSRSRANQDILPDCQPWVLVLDQHGAYYPCRKCQGIQMKSCCSVYLETSRCPTGYWIVHRNGHDPYDIRRRLIRIFCCHFIRPSHHTKGNPQ